MSTQAPSPDFSQPGSYVSGTGGPNPAGVVSRPAGVSATGVLSIIAGILGTMSSVSVGISLLFQDAIANMSMPPTKGQSSDQVKAMEEMAAATQEIAARYNWFNGGISALTFFISIGLLIGGVGLLMSRPSARVLLKRTFVAAIVIEILAAILYVVSQLELAPVMSKYMGQMTGGGGGQIAPGGAQTMMLIIMYFGLALWIVWGITKVILYAVGNRYLSRTHVIEYLKTAANRKTV